MFVADISYLSISLMFVLFGDVAEPFGKFLRIEPEQQFHKASLNFMIPMPISHIFLPQISQSRRHCLLDANSLTIIKSLSQLSVYKTWLETHDINWNVGSF